MQLLKRISIIFLIGVFAFTSLVPATTTEAATTISDVSTSASKYNAIKWTVDNKLLKLTNKRFNPKGNITEQDVVGMFARLDKNFTFSYTTDMMYNFYSDFKLPLKGTTNKQSRANTLTRAQFAIVYAAFNGLDLSSQQAVQYMYVNELSAGSAGERTYASFNPNARLTREDAAVFLWRIAKKGQIAVVGLKYSASGRDNSKITLPPGFTGSTTSEFNGSTGSGNTVVGPTNVNNPLQSITVEKPELIANGIDSSLVQVEFKACKGQTISYDKSYSFEVKSKNTIITSTNPVAQPAGQILNTAGEPSSVINTDGPTLTFRVVAPKLTKSLKDTILITIKNNTDSNMACFTNQTMQVQLTYVPQAELRIAYEVYDADFPDEIQTDQKPEYPPYAEVPAYFTNGKITVHDIDTDAKEFQISQRTTYKDAFGQSVTGELFYDDAGPGIEYQYATLKANGYPIALWLFEKILESQLEQAPFSVLVDYKLNSDGRPEYNLVLENAVVAAAVENQDPVITIIELFNYLPPEAELTLEHYDSVKSIMAIYSGLSGYNNNLFTLYQGGKIAGALQAANAKVDTLKASADLATRPTTMKRYTKVIVSLVLPGGTIITDYDGQVKISFDGKEQIARFDKNTSDYLKGTGHAGAAVAFFDSVIYGDSQVTAEIVLPDNDYNTMMKSILNKTHEKTIYTDYRFAENTCSNNAEVAFVVDYSSSMQAVDPDNWRGSKTMSMMKQLELDYAVQAKYDTKGTVLQTGEYKNFKANLSYAEFTDNGATNAVNGITQVLNKFSGDVNATKSIVLVSDGKSSEVQLQQLLLKAKQQNIKIFTVGIGEKSQVNEILLARIAKETGGQFYHVLDKAQLHFAYQSIIDSVLCGKIYSSCLNNPTLFNNTNVVIRSGKVIMSTRISTNCTDVAKVVVRYSSVYGDVQFELTKKNATLFNTTKYITQLEHFDVYEDVQFLAYNKDGEFLSSKTIKVQQ